MHIQKYPLQLIRLVRVCFGNSYLNRFQIPLSSWNLFELEYSEVLNFVVILKIFYDYTNNYLKFDHDCNVRKFAHVIFVRIPFYSTPSAVSNQPFLGHFVWQNRKKRTNSIINKNINYFFGLNLSIRFSADYGLNIYRIVHWLTR